MRQTQQYIRKNVWEVGGDWADPILWYARGVAAMKARALADRTSWRFYGAIHGIDEQLWRRLGYLSQSDPMPSIALRRDFWKQCQHGSWHFLPWHRGYILAFEANIREVVTNLGGPADWALPYWNYFKPNQSQLPPAFASPDWPDGQGDNPLFVQQRYGPADDGNVYVALLTFPWVLFMIDKGARRVPSRVSGLPQSETIKMGTACARRGYGGGCSGSSTR